MPGPFSLTSAKDHVRVELTPEQAEDWLDRGFGKGLSSKDAEEKLRYLGVPTQLGDDGTTLELAEPTPQPGMS